MPHSLRPLLIACCAAAVGTLSAAAAETQPLPADAVLQRTLLSYAAAKTPEATKSIERWCRDSLAATNYQRDSFLLQRGAAYTDDSKSAAMLRVVTALAQLESQEADLLCAPGSIP